MPANSLTSAATTVMNDLKLVVDVLDAIEARDCDLGKLFVIIAGHFALQPQRAGMKRTHDPAIQMAGAQFERPFCLSNDLSRSRASFRGWIKHFPGDSYANLGETRRRMPSPA